MTTLIILSYVVGAIPNFLLLWEYGFKTRWETSTAGRALMLLFVIVALNYCLQLGTSLAPGFFHSWPGVAIRVSVRFAIAGAMWNLYRVFRKAQRVNRREVNGGTDG